MAITVSSQPDPNTGDRVSVKILTVADVPFQKGGGTPVFTIQEATVHAENRFITSIVLDKDFFTEPDGVIVTIEGSNLSDLISRAGRGNRIQIFLNGNINFDGFIFNVKLSYDKSHSSLTLECKDLLEFMAQGSVPPNMFGVDKNFLSNYHFPASATLLDAVRFLCNIFRLSLLDQVPNVPQLYVTTSDNGIYDPKDPLIPGKRVSVDPKNNKLFKINTRDLTFATGFAAGLRVKGKKAGANTKSWNHALDRLNTPHKGETYLAYIKRLVKLSGGHIKMAPGSADTIVLQSPTYERDVTSPFRINHYLNPSDNRNNCESAKLHTSMDKQYSVVILEGRQLSNPQFHLTDYKFIAVNELSGYKLSNGPYQFLNLEPVETVQLFIEALVDVPSANLIHLANSAPPSGPSYDFTQFNDKLYFERFGLGGLDIKTTVCLPLYKESNSATTIPQLHFEALQELAAVQDKAVEFTYKVKGWTQPTSTGKKAIWQPNMMVTVFEEYLNHGSGQELNLWIKRVTYHYDKHGGAWCEVTCTLPYTHQYELTDDPVSVVPAHNDTGFHMTKQLFQKRIQQLQQIVPAQGALEKQFSAALISADQNPFGKPK